MVPIAQLSDQNQPMLDLLAHRLGVSADRLGKAFRLSPR